jgi:hypothetical protein
MKRAAIAALAAIGIAVAAPAAADEARAKRLAAFLPKPLDGYEAPPAVTQVIAEGESKGSYAIGTYSKAGQSLTVRIADVVPPTTRSAVGDPARHGAAPVTVKDQKGILREAPSGAGSAALVVADRFTVEFNWTSALKGEWAKYAEAIDYRGLAAVE